MNPTTGWTPHPMPTQSPAGAVPSRRRVAQGGPGGRRTGAAGGALLRPAGGRRGRLPDPPDQRRRPGGLRRLPIRQERPGRRAGAVHADHVGAVDCHLVHRRQPAVPVGPGRLADRGDRSVVSGLGVDVSRPLSYLYTRPLLERRFGPAGVPWDQLWRQLPRFRRLWRVSSVLWAIGLAASTRHCAC